METKQKSNWFQTTELIYTAICKDMDTATEKSLSSQYPKFVVMHEFFRLLRGEAFLFGGVRKELLDGEQKKLYDMEDNIARKLQSIKKTLNSNDPSTRHYIEEMKRQFDV